MMNWRGLGNKRLEPNSGYNSGISLKGLRKTTINPSQNRFNFRGGVEFSLLSHPYQRYIYLNAITVRLPERKTAPPPCIVQA
jgi:hypothetical protein